MTRYSYDGDGYITQIVNPQGSVTKLQWGGLHKLVGRTNANGDRVALRYNYEGELLEIHNEADEVHRLERDVVGMLVGETTFDGRSFSYQNDGLGRVIRTVDNAEETTEVVYDAAGRIVQQLFHDGSAREYQYDWCGRITSAENNSSKVIFQRDKLGRIVREQITANGTSHWVEAQLDADGFRCARKTSLGHEEKIDRNAYGGRLRTIVDGSQVIGHERDELGREVSRALPQGGKLINEYDAMSRLTRRAALAPGVTAQPVTDEPEWLGKRAIDETHELKFRYGWDGELVARDDSHRGRSEYRYDPVGHLLACVPEQAKEQLFQYDSRGNRFETTAGSEAREYWAGNRVVRKGNTEYQWDAVGRLVEKRQPASDGSGEAVWRLDWNCEGQLTKAYLPDGTAVEYSYDAFSRRVGKKVVSTTSDGQRETETVSFVWDGNHIAHDIRVAARAAGDPIVEERTFGFTDNQFEPLYQTNAPEDSTSPARTVHYLNDQVGAVDCLIDGRGQRVWACTRTPWGQSEEGASGEASPFRMQGQYLDEETGLHYNRHRYYDPDTGTFISADPLGLDAGHHDYQYAPNPLQWIDPLGLVTAALMTAMEGAGRKVERGSTAHHIVQRNGGGDGGDRGRACLKKHDISIDHASNGANLRGTARTQRDHAGHEKRCEGYHCGTDIHGDAAQLRVAERLEAADARGGKAAVLEELDTMGEIMETTAPGERNL